jgi:branched-chain amino acid transport system substrate-binding protein
MEFVEGEHHWYGAQMARDEINAVGGISLGGEEYRVKLTRVDSNEMLSPADAVSAMERIITRDNVDFVVGGFRSEAVLAMQDVAMDYQMIFLGCGASDAELNSRVTKDYDRYKYWFRVTPFSNVKLIENVLSELEMAGSIMKQELSIEEELKVAIIAEAAVWADPMVSLFKAVLPASLGMQVVGAWRPSATATDVTAELTAIEDSDAHLILTILSGPVGIPYAKQLGELEIPAASVGINVEAQKDGFWDATAGHGNYETTLNFYAEGVAITDLTKSFVERFVEKFGETPTYNAGTYDAILLLKEAIERAGTLDADAVVVELEKTDFVGPGARIVFTENHDLRYGPGYATGIATQWQDGEQDGEMKCVWPNLGVDEWEGLMYEGTVLWEIPQRVIERFTQQ